ncbi:hypothetical protein A4X09_0g5622 [Tilletia walkeri]|uniref:Fanconi-associated nuclease n=1 Tax=Tilletia walkeri TaxID=117179 RepID=A0A8X7T2Q7_9BASI|nr:hypothetical protein A4X09_0g5622 [Tilletia walkeri]
MPLHLAHHKSYHPYNEKNKERVRQDEEEERLRLEGEERQRQDAEAEARIEALRRSKGGSAAHEDARTSSRSGHAAQQLQHINFFEDAEASSSRAGSSSRSNRQSNAAQERRSDKPRLDRETLAHALGGPTAAQDRQPWYAAPDLQGAAQSNKSAEQKLKAVDRDIKLKDRHDPMKAMQGMVAKRRENKEQRARASGSSQMQESPYREASSPAPWAEAGDYSNQFNRDDVRAARKRRRESSPTPHHHRRSSGDDGDDSRGGKRRAREDSTDQGPSSPRWRESRFAGTHNQASSSMSTDYGTRGHHRAGAPFATFSDAEIPDPAHNRGKVISPPSTGASSTEMALSFPPCGQAFPPARTTPYLHESALASSSTTSLNESTFPIAPPPSSSFDDIKSEPDSDDIPIADLVDHEPYYEPTLGVSRIDIPPARRETDDDSDVDSVSPSPPTIKAEPSSGTVFSGPPSSHRDTPSRSASLSTSSPVKPSQQAVPSPEALTPSVKLEPSSGQSLLRAVQEDVHPSSQHEENDDAIAVKSEPQTQRLPSQPDHSTLPGMPTLEEAGMPQDSTVEESAHDSQDDQMQLRRPLTLIDAQRTGLLPNPWGRSTTAALLNCMMPPSTQSSEFDELAPGSQMSVSCEEPALPPVTPKRPTNASTYTDESPESLQEEAAELDADEGHDPTAPTEVEESTVDHATTSAQATEAMEEPERSQQQQWAEGIWHSQKFKEKRPEIPNIFERMQMRARLEAGGQAVPKVISPQNADDSGVFLPNATTEDNGDDIDDEGLTTAERRFRESMYPAALQEMIDTVLEHEAFLFSANEVAFLRSYAKMSYDARYLFSRLILRKYKWHRLCFLKYDTDLKDMAGTVRELARPWPELEAQHGEHVCDPSTVDDPLLTRFAYTQKDVGFQDRIADMMKLMTLDELKVLAKKMNVLKPAHTTRELVIEALMSVKGQSTLAGPDKRWLSSGPSRSPRAPSSSSGKREGHLRQLTLNFDWSGNKTAQSGQLHSSVQSIVGEVVQVPAEVRCLIDRLALVYYRGNVYNSVGSVLKDSILERCKKRKFPEVEVQRSNDIFKSRDHLKRYERACAREYRIAMLLDGPYEVNRTATNSAELYIGQTAYNANGEALPPPKSPEALAAGVALFEEILQEWKDAVAECEKDCPDGGDRITYHRMRFHPGWPLTRVMYKAGTCFSHLKQHHREKEILRLLLDQKVFCRGKRGDWYDRLALLEERYCEQKTKGGRLALQIAIRGVEDPDTHFVYLGPLQKRIARLQVAKLTQLPFREQRKFTIFNKNTVEVIKIKGFRLDKMLVKSESSSSVQTNSSGDNQQKPKQAWAQLFTKKSSPAKSAPGSRMLKGKNAIRGAPSSGPSPSPPRMSPANDIDTTGFVKRPVLQKEVLIERFGTSPGPSRLRSPQMNPASSVDAIVVEDDDENDLSEVYEVIGRQIKNDMHTAWRGLDKQPCRVEHLVLQHFEKDGFKGVHDEGSVLTTLFVLAMWDVIYMSVEGAFETRYQSEPLDMRSDAFAIVRRDQITQRLSAIAEIGGLEFIMAADERERPRQTWASGCNWDYSREMLLEVTECLGGRPLSTICQILCEERQHCQSGMPDLCVWNMKTKEVRFVEVKGPGDELRSKQLVWLEYLYRAGAKVQLASVSDIKDLPAAKREPRSSSATKK